MKHLPQWQWWFARRPSPVWLAILMAGLACAGGLTYAKLHLDAQLARRTQQLARLQELSALATPRPKPAPAMLSPAASRQLDRQVALLNRDWVRLSTLLAPKDQAIRLLGMDVDPATGAIRISGTVDSATAANAYAKKLSRHAESLRQVRLLGLERRAEGTHFEIGAQWID